MCNLQGGAKVLMCERTRRQFLRFAIKMKIAEEDSIAIIQFIFHEILYAIALEWHGQTVGLLHLEALTHGQAKLG